MRSFAKTALLALAHIVVTPLGLASLLFLRAWNSEASFEIAAHTLALVPGLPGRYLRFAFYRQTLPRVGDNLAMAFGSFFSHATARLGSDVSIGAYCILGTVDIGDRVRIASRVSIPSGRHQHGRLGHAAGLDREVSLERVTIGADVWLGEGAIVMADVGDNGVVGAGAVVVKPVPEWHVAVGNPAQARPVVRGSAAHAATDASGEPVA